MSILSESIYNRIQTELSKKGISANKMLKDCSINTSFMSDLKSKKTMPSVDKMLSIAQYLNVSMDYLILGIDNLPPTLRGDEKRLLRLYNELDFSGRRKLMIQLFKTVRKNKEDRAWWETHHDVVERLMVDSFGPDWNKAPEPDPNSGVVLTKEEIESFPDFEEDDGPHSVMREVVVYYQPASAGTGTFLDSDDYDLIDFPVDEIPIQTTFGVRVSGHSMEPDYEDECIVFVKQQRTLEPGELGVFVLNGDAYFKQLSKVGKTTYLESLNPAYHSIQIRPSDELRTVGKVIGKYRD